jgi:phage terminase large subunit-like protein
MLVQTGSQLVVGTRKHHDDLYGHLLNDATFDVLETPAVSEWPEKYEFIYDKDEYGREVVRDVQITGKAVVLWPEERPIEYLLKERLSVGQRLFSREFQNEVQDDSAAAIKWSWLELAKGQGAALSLYEIPHEAKGLDIVQGWDLSLVTDARAAETRDTDYTVGITWGRDSNGCRYLLGIARHRGLSPAQLRGVVLAEYKKFAGMGHPPRVVAVEKNNFGELHFMGLQRTTDLPLKAHLTTGRNKADPWDGVPALSVLFENGKVVLPTRTHEDEEAVDPLVQELWGLGRESHDDTVMALWIAETWLRKAGFVYSVSFGDDNELTGTADERLIGAAAVSDADDLHSQTNVNGDRSTVVENSAREAWDGLPWFN